MTYRLLDPRRAAALRTARWSYPEVGGLDRSPLPSGYRHLSETVLLPVGVEPADCRSVLWNWAVQSGAGVRVSADGPVRQGAVAELRIGPATFSILAPVRVVSAVDTVDRVGFTYGTLPGHPEQGEESFVVHRRPDGRVEARIRAFSREARWFSRVGAPLTHLVQAAAIRRYLAVLSER